MGSIIMSVAVLAIGVAIGLLRGGNLEALRSVRPEWPLVLVAGFAMQAVAENLDVTGATSLAVTGMFALSVALVANASIRGALIAATGVTMNLVALVINGAVPIRFEALSEAGLIAAGTQREQITSVGHLVELETAETRLGWLGDTIPIAALDSVISIGDLVTFAGVVVIISGLMAARRSVGVPVHALFDPPIALEFGGPRDLEGPVDLEAAQLEPAPGVLDIAAETPVIDVATHPRAPVAAPIDLTADPDDLWANDDTGVRILGPSTKSDR